jgi:hypothetical protein
MNEDLVTPVYSLWPILLALGILLVAVGVVSNVGISVLGLLMLIASIIGWVWEDRAESEEKEHDERR